MGNIHPQVTEPLIQEVFASAGHVEGCKLIRKEKVLALAVKLLSERPMYCENGWNFGELIEILTNTLLNY